MTSNEKFNTGNIHTSTMTILFITSLLSRNENDISLVAKGFLDMQEKTLYGSWNAIRGNYVNK